MIRRAILAAALGCAALAARPGPLAAQTFPQPLNNASSTLAANYTAGSGSLAVAAGEGARFGTPSPSAPVRITVAAKSTLSNGQIGPNTARAIFDCTARSGDVLSGLTAVEGTSDRNFTRGDPVQVLITAGMISGLQDAVSSATGTAAGALVKAQNLADVPSVATARTNLGLGTAATHPDADYAHAAGDETIAGVKTHTSKVVAPQVDFGTQGGTIASPTPATVLHHQPVDAARFGPWQLLYSGEWFTYNGTQYWDPICYFGYNPSPDPNNPGRTDAHTSTWNIEAEYVEPTTGATTTEFYCEFLSPQDDGAGRIQRRPIMFTLDQASGAVRGELQLGPAAGTFGSFTIDAGTGVPGQYSIAAFLAGASQATSSIQLLSPTTQLGGLTLANALDTAVGTIRFGTGTGQDGNRSIVGVDAELQLGTTLTKLRATATASGLTMLSNAADGVDAFVLNAATSHATGKLWQVQNVGAAVAAVYPKGRLVSGNAGNLGSAGAQLEAHARDGATPIFAGYTSTEGNPAVLVAADGRVSIDHTPNARALTIYQNTGAAGDYAALGFQHNASTAIAASEVRNYNPAGGNYADWAVWVTNASGTYTERLRIHGDTGTVNITNALVVGGAITPAHLANAAAPVDSIYYSTDASAVGYKDAGGTFHAFY